MSRWMRWAGLIALAGFLLASSSATAQTGAGEEDAAQNFFRDEFAIDVDPFSGTFSTSIPIEVPSFRGLEPRLSLNYSSSGRNGFVGVGWTLGGISYIERVSPGKGAPRYDSSDTFMLDGVELVPNCTTLGGDHCTRIQSYKQIDRTGSTWTVREKDGTTAVYREVIGEGSDTFRWGIDTVTDTSGNTVSYNYSSDSGGNDAYPTSITYNGTTITIRNESRTDDITFATGKSLRDMERRLDDIDIVVNGVRARRYQMLWDYSTNGSRSLLVGVRLFGTNNSSTLPDATFTYEDGSQGDFDNPDDETGISLFTNFSQVLAGDYDGDKSTDLFYVANNGSEYEAWLSLENGQYNDENINPGSGYPNTGDRWMGGDFNGDGRSDIAHAAGNGDLYIWYAEGVGSSFDFDVDDVTTSGGNPPPAHIQSAWTTGDFNGDGMTDLAQANASTIWIWQSDGDHSFVVSSFPTGNDAALAHNWKWLAADLNGDGNTDLVQVGLQTNANDMFSYISNGDFTFDRMDTTRPGSLPAFQGGKWRAGDFNGDGKTDLLHIGAADNQLTIYYSEGASEDDSFSTQSLSKPSGYPSTQGGWWFPININGDGRMDLYHVAADGTVRLWISEDEPGAWENQTEDPNGYPTVFGGRWQSGDANGDGRDDLIHVASDNHIWTWFSGGVTDNRMTSASSRFGGSTTIQYVPSTTWNNGFLPVGMINHTVSSITRDDGRSNTHSVTYEYQDGQWNSAERCFLGYGRVKKILDSAGNYEETLALQSDNCTTKPEFVYQRDSGDDIITYVELEYDDQASSPPFYTLETGNWSYECNGNTSCFRTYTTTAYDQYANVTQIVEHGEFGVSGDERTVVRQYYPNVGAYIVDRVGRERTFSGLSASGTPVAETRFRYDNRTSYTQSPIDGLLTMARVWDDENGQWHETESGYDSFGNKTSETDPRNFTTTTVYDTTNQIFPTQICPPLIPCTVQTWIASLGRIDTVTDANGQETDYDYDVFGRPTTITYPNNEETTYGYFNVGSPTSQRVRISEPDHTSNGLFVDRYFGGFGREWRSVREGGETVLTDYHEVTDRVDRKSLPYKSPESPRYQRFEYDEARRIDRIVEPSNEATRIVYGDGFVEHIDPMNKRRFTYRDGLNRVVSVRERNGSANYDTDYEYDALDNLTMVTDELQNVATFEYDSLSRKLEACDFDMGCWNYTYDAAGNLLTTTDAKNQQTIHTYDGLGRPLTRTNEAGEVTTWTYDENGRGESEGRLTTVAYPNGVERFTYDEMGLETQIERCVDGDCRTINQTYEAARLKTLQYPDGETITLGYDTEGYLDSASGLVTSTNRNARGQITSLVYANGVTTTINYNNPYDLMSDVTVSGPGGTLYQATYSYNDSSQIVTIASSTHSEMNVTYGYDDLYRLTSVSPNGPATISQSFVYDPIGNMTSNSDLGTYSYSELGKPHAVSVAGDLHHEYDANGNVTSVTTRQADCVDIVRLNGWNADNRLAFVSAGGKTTRYTYGDGERIKKSGPDGTTHYFGNLLEVNDPAGTNELVKYYYVGSILVAKEEGGQKQWYHRDHVESTRVLSDAGGAEAAKYEYEAFGEVISSTGSGENDRQFGAHQLDPESDLLYMGARYYDPAVSRFSQPDSIVPEPDDPQSWNRYSYARNNPVNRVDPTGHADWFNWDTALDVAQLGIGVAGLIPVVGNVADAANVAISTARGDLVGAAIDAASMVPAAGQAAGATAITARLARLTARLGSKADVARAVGRGVEEGVDGVAGASRASGGAAEAAQEAAGAVGNALPPRGSVGLDTNAIIARLEGDASDVKAVNDALAGRNPRVSITAAKEFLRGGGDINALRAFLKESGGGVAAGAPKEIVQELRARGLKSADAQVVGSAVEEGTKVLTRDKGILRKAGEVAEKF